MGLAQQALLAFQQGDYVSAEKLFNHLLIQNQNDSNILYYLSLIYLNNNSLQAAYDHIERAISINDQLDYLHQHKGEILFRANETDRAIAACYQTLILNPKNEQAIKMLLNMQESSRNMDATIDIYNVSGLRKYCENNSLSCVDVFPEKEVDITSTLNSQHKNQIGKILHQNKTGKSYIAELHDVHVIGQAGYIITEDDFLLDDDFEEIDLDRVNILSNVKHITLLYYDGAGGINDSARVTAIVPNNIVDLDECVLLTARGTGNYFHWLIEVIPKIHILGKQGGYENVPFLVEAGMPKQHYEILKIYAGEQREIIFADVNSHYRIKHAVIPSRLSNLVFDYQPGFTPQYNDFRFNPIAIEYLRTVIQKNSPESKGKKIYLSRKGSKTRTLTNEERVESIFSNHGFDIISTAEMSFLEQVELFSSAEVIAGPSGASFSNIVFAPKGCKVILLTQEGEDTHVIYHSLACAVGIHYFYSVKGKKNESSAVLGFHSDFEIELTDIDKLLQSIG